jgi:hypothetical protein
MKIESITQRALLALVAVVAALSLTACTDVSPKVVAGPGPGSFPPGDGGPVVERERPVSGVSGVVLAGVGDVYVRQGGSTSLRIRAEEQIHEYIRTDVVGGMLVIQFVDGSTFHNGSPIEYHLTVPELRHAEITGVGRIVGSGISTDELTLILNGVGELDLSGLNVTRLEVSMSNLGDVRLDGVAQTQSVSVGGRGDYRAGGLASSTAGVTIGSGGSATVRVSDRLEATIDGSGSVYYLGSPLVERDGYGSGTVEQIG